jgi:hypothetical protein
VLLVHLPGVRGGAGQAGISLIRNTAESSSRYRFSVVRGMPDAVASVAGTSRPPERPASNASSRRRSPRRSIAASSWPGCSCLPAGRRSA